MKRLAGILLFIVLFIGAGKVFRFLLVDDTQSWTRLMLHEFYAQDDIDVLFVGSSHCYTALDPTITDELFQCNTFNAGSSLQAQDASFALIREAVERYHVRQVYMEMYYLMTDNDEYADRTQLTGTYIVSDYMRPSLNKARFLLNASSPKYYVNSFIPARRDRENLADPAAVVSLVKAKMTPAYRNYEPFAGYRTKGFIANGERIETPCLIDNAGYDRIHTESPSRDWVRTIREIMAYCRKHDVQLTFFSSPMTLFQTAAVENYDEYIGFIRDLVSEYGVEYYDFNLVRPAYWDPSNDYFSDAGHMNASGAAVFSRLFGDFFTGKISAEALFYPSMAEKLEESGTGFLGLSFLDSGDGTRKFKVVTGTLSGEDPEVTVISDRGDTRSSEGRYFSVPQGEHGILKIRLNGTEIETEY